MKRFVFVVALFAGVGGYIFGKCSVANKPTKQIRQPIQSGSWFNGRLVKPLVVGQAWVNSLGELL